MSAGTSLEQMLGVYKWVVDDVTKAVREEFLNEGVDTQMLEDLKQLWESKLVQSGALSRPVQPTSSTRRMQEAHSQSKDHHLPLQQQTHSQPTPPSQPQADKVGSSSVIQQALPRGSPSSQSPAPPPPASASVSSHSSLPPPLIDASQLHMIQALRQATATRTLQLQQAGSSLASSQSNAAAATTISQDLSNSIPSATSSSSSSQPRSIPTPTVQTQANATTSVGAGMLPHSAAALYSAMTSGVQPLMMSNPAAAAAAVAAAGMPLFPQAGFQYAPVQTPNGIFYLPIALGSLQQTAATASLAVQQQGSGTQESGARSIDQSDGPHPLTSASQARSQPILGTTEHQPMKRKLGSCIVQLDGPAEGSSSEDTDDGSSDSEVDELDVAYDDDDPLNSNDDADSDEGDEAVWETDNTIVCQFEKVYRVRTRWKFALKDGIMNLRGHDYIFTKVNGEADW